MCVLCNRAFDLLNTLWRPTKLHDKFYLSQKLSLSQSIALSLSLSPSLWLSLSMIILMVAISDHFPLRHVSIALRTMPKSRLDAPTKNKSKKTKEKGKVCEKWKAKANQGKVNFLIETICEKKKETITTKKAKTA